jgi:phospholipase C
MSRNEASAAIVGLSAGRPPPDIDGVAPSLPADGGPASAGNGRSAFERPQPASSASETRAEIPAEGRAVTICSRPADAAAIIIAVNKGARHLKRPRHITRRAAIRLGLATAGGAAVGCEPATPVRRGVVTTPDAAGDGRPAAGDIAPARDAGSDNSPTDAAQPDAAAPDTAPPDRTPADTAAPDTEPQSKLTPDELLAGIDTFVVLCMENRSFDHVLGARRLLEERPVEGLRAEMHNPDRDGRPVLIHRLNGFSHVDPPHDWDPVHGQWNEGAMDGFVRIHPGPDAAQVMGYYTREEQPVTWALADAFVTCDHWFSSVLGPTWPNRFYLHGATALGVQTNAPALGLPTVFGRLEEVGKTHRNYFCDIAWATGGYLRLANNAGIERFFADARNGELPNVAFVDPQFFGAGANDDHPDHDVRLGQAFIAAVYAALRSSPQWNLGALRLR